jgi:predicted ATP-grasp superfamily ATP-dependent carboligase
MRVLVTDASYKNALCAIRSLGHHGATVVVADTSSRAQGFFSRHAASRLTYPDPSSEAEAFVQVLLERAGRGLDVILPIGYAATSALSRHRSAFDGLAHVPVADWPAMEVARNKAKTLALAADLGVPAPRTFASPKEVDRFPVVLKGALGSGDVRYIRSRDELDSADTDGMVLQEYIPGDGVGYYALYEHGTVRAEFMHRRIREFPVSGGASTAAESIDDDSLRELGRRLLDALQWHGVAMVEFKRDRRDGSLRLMEINPKFWGSLDLSVAAGVDFPWLTVQMAAGVPFKDVRAYPTGVRFQWFFEDLLHAAARPRDLGAVVRDACNPRVGSDLSRRDWKPNAIAGYQAVRKVGRLLRQGTPGRAEGQLGALRTDRDAAPKDSVLDD